PGTEVGPGLERVEPGVGLGVGLLDQVLRVGGVTRHPQRRAVQLVEKRHGQLLELLGALLRSVGMQLGRQPELLTCRYPGVYPPTGVVENRGPHRTLLLRAPGTIRGPR